MSASTQAHPNRDGKPKFPIDIASAQAKADERFSAADTDSSGTISLAEFEAAKFADGKRKGMRTKRKMRERKRQARSTADSQVRADRKAARAAHKEQVRAELFALMDTDGDGSVSAEEHANADHHALRKTAVKRTMFTRLDANSDGQLTRDELPNRVERLNALDADGDGLVTKKEMRAARKAKHG